MGNKTGETASETNDYFNAKRERQLKNAIEYEKEQNPVTDFEFNPDIYRTDKTPADIIREGKCVAYYDTQSACWRYGDRSNPSPQDEPFERHKGKDDFDEDIDNLKKNKAQAEAA